MGGSWSGSGREWEGVLMRGSGSGSGGGSVNGREWDWEC